MLSVRPAWRASNIRLDQGLNWTRGCHNPLGNLRSAEPEEAKKQTFEFERIVCSCINTIRLD